MRVVIVEVSDAVRREIKEGLGRIGAEAREFRKSAEALEFLRHGNAVAVALVSWDLPEAEGLNFALELRSDKRFDGIRLVMLACRPSTTAILEAVRLGVDDCLVKPFTRQQLLEKLEQLNLAS